MRLLFSGLALSWAPSVLGAQGLVAPHNYEALTIASDSVGTCRVSDESTPDNAQKTRTIRFNAEAIDTERAIRIVEYPSNIVAYVESVSGRDGPAGTLRGIVARIDSSGGISGSSQFAKHIPGDPRPVPTERPLTVSELKRIPLMVNWIRVRCGHGRGRRTIEIDEIR